MGRDLVFTLRFFLSKFFPLIGNVTILMILTFFLCRHLPGSQFVLEDQVMHPTVQRALISYYGVDQSIFQQFGLFVKDLSRGELGESIHFPGRRVSDLLWEFGKSSLILGWGAFVFSLLLTGLLLFWSRVLAPSCRSKLELTLIGLMSIPSLFLFPFAVWLLAYQWELFPVAGIRQSTGYILPLLLLSLKPTIIMCRTLGVEIDRALTQKHIAVFRSLGFSERQLVFKWGLKNSLAGLFSQLGPLLAGLISGSFLIEVLFAIPGMGYQFVQGILNRDWPLIQGMVLIYGGILVFLYWLTEEALQAVSKGISNEMD